MSTRIARSSKLAFDRGHSNRLCARIVRRNRLARDVFDKISQPSVFLWNALIRAYSWSGHFDKAIELYYQMVDLGVEPNKFTFPLVLQAFVSMLALEKGVSSFQGRALQLRRFLVMLLTLENTDSCSFYCFITQEARERGARQLEKEGVMGAYDSGLLRGREINMESNIHRPRVPNRRTNGRMSATRPVRGRRL
uniref:Pentatricopeptide repeat-containing protein n=1 Tax=Ananas comosus var. bracteatus TaxID=296719 RepID=A0A6V7PX31_ANACO|nr:unnamed protein product [Ananas comosus var. bracteatus]